MALYSMLSRASSSSMIPLSVRVVGSLSPFYEPIISTAPLGVENRSLFHPLCRPMILLLPSHPYSTSTSISIKSHSKISSSDQNLIRSIKSEINCAIESVLPDSEVEIPRSFPFEIQDKPGESIVTLERKYRDETIKIEIDLHNAGSEEKADDNENTDENNDEGNLEANIPLIVSVSKRNGMCLHIDARAFPERITVNCVSLEILGSSPITYEGPEFLNLDESLQQEFHKYLDVRGLNPSMTNFLLEYMINKDSKEYLRWLENVEKFLKN